MSAALQPETEDDDGLEVAVAEVRLPPMPENAARKVKASATKILDGIMLRSFEQTSSASLS